MSEPFDFDEYDFNKNNERDSVDTLELIRDSADLFEPTSKEINEIDFNYKPKYRELSQQNEINVVLSSLTNEEKACSKQDIQNDTKNSLNESRQSFLAISSANSSINIETKLNPLSIIEISKKSDSSKDQNKNETLKNNEEDEVETSDLAHLEPKLREAWIKMRKLDKILERVTKKEKIVKRETISLIEKNKAELEILRLTSDHKESKQEAENTAHFLALSYIDLDDEIEIDSLMDIKEASTTPLFKTQVPNEMDEFFFSNSKNEENNSYKSTDTNKKNHESISSTKLKTSSNISEKKKKISVNVNVKRKNHTEKDFINRNIQLVQDTGGALAMTEDEKQRLNEIMLDMEEFEDVKENKNKDQFMIEEKNENTNYLVEYNPYTILLAEGDGFTPDRIESERLKEIDSKLEKRNNSRLLSDSKKSFESAHSKTNISEDASNYNIDSESYYGIQNLGVKQVKLNDDLDENEFGDKFIREARLTREQETRLKTIEFQLEKLKSISESNEEAEFEKRSESKITLISENQLKILLEQCTMELNERNLNQDQKLDILKEKEAYTNHYDDSDSLSIITNNRIITEKSITPFLPENLVSSLIEQAKSEGIIATIDNNKKVNSQERSYYEEALEIIESTRRITINDFEKNEQEVFKNSHNSENNEYLNENETNNFKKMTQETKSIVEKNTFEKESYESNVISNKLPPLYTKDSVDEMHQIETNNFQRTTSSISSSLSNSTLPKINSRFLPK